MLITKFNYTPKGHFDFIDDHGQDVTGEIILHFNTGEVLSNFNRKFIRIPESLWGKREVYITDADGELVSFDSGISDKYFLNKTNDKIEYALFKKNCMNFGVFPRKQKKIIRHKEKMSLGFENEFLKLELPFDIEMPYFFEVKQAQDSILVDFTKKNNTYFLDLTKVDLNEIVSIDLIDYRFKMEIHKCIYSDFIPEYSYPTNDLNKIYVDEDGLLVFPKNIAVFGQLGKNHFSVNTTSKIEVSDFREYKEQNDQTLEFFTFYRGVLVNLGLEISPNISNNEDFYVFKNELIMYGDRRLLGNVRHHISSSIPLVVDVKNFSLENQKVELELPREITTIQIFKSTNNLNGPYSELSVTTKNKSALVDIHNTFDGLGFENGMKNMLLFAYVSFHGENKPSFYHLQLIDNSRMTNELMFNYRIPLDGGIGKYKQYVQLYKTENKNLIFLKGALHNLANESLGWTAQVESITRQVEKQYYKLQLKIVGDEITDECVHSVRLINRNKLDPKENDYSVSVIGYEKNVVTVETLVSLESNYVPFYWDLFVVLNRNSKEKIVIQVDKLSDKLKNLIDVDVFDKEIRSKENNILYPYVTAGGSLAFTYRGLESYETSLNFKKEIIAGKVFKLFKRYFENKNIWIVFEKNSYGAHDNGFYFFKYVYEHEKHPNTYYVIRKDSPEYHNLDGMRDRVLKFMSFKYFIYMFAARLFISSDTKFHSYNLQRRDSILAKTMMNKKNVFLQHGMNGIKKVPVFHKKRGLLDLIISPSDFEREHINIKDWGYSPNEVVSTGYARWDSYEDKTEQIPYKQIFMMPTWRKSMEGMSKEEFIKTSFFKEYQSFLNSPRLKKVMLENNVRLAFFLHPYFRNYVDLFNIDDSFIDKYGYLDVDMGEEIMKSSMMISDYSSVLWDMFYLEKPVLFYQFDQTDYLKSEGSYLNYETDLFGDVVFDANDAIQKVIEYIQSDFMEKYIYTQMRNKYMNFHDHNNSSRIYKAILSKKKLLGIENRWTFSRKVRRKLWKIKKKFFNELSTK